MIYDDYDGSLTPKHEYKCPRVGCRYETTAFTRAGMLRLADEHRMQHQREDREREFKFRTMGYKAPEEYKR